MDINKFKINFRNIFSFDKAKNAVIALALASIFNPALNRCGIKRKKNLKYFEGICVQALKEQRSRFDYFFFRNSQILSIPYLFLAIEVLKLFKVFCCRRKICILNYLLQSIFSPHSLRPGLSIEIRPNTLIYFFFRLIFVNSYHSYQSQ